MSHPKAEGIVDLLAANGFTAAIESIELAPVDPKRPSGIEIVLGEQPLLVVAVLQAERWNAVADWIDEAVLAVADIVAERDPSARQWDLTFLLLLDLELTGDDLPAAASWASSTSYARRVIADDLAGSPLEQGLASVLPIGLTAAVKMGSGVFDELRTQLSKELGEEAANLAVTSFERTGKVELP